MQKGKLIIFSAPSGSGKTTIVKYLLTKKLNLTFSISATSRKPRTNETNGVDYYFLSEAAFRKKIDNNEFLEWEEVYKGVCYGTLKSEVERIRNTGQHVVFDVDVVGGVNIKKYFTDQAMAIFIEPPSLKVLHNRLLARKTENPETLKMRIDKAEHELKYAGFFDHIVINDDLEQACLEVESLVRNFISK